MASTRTNRAKALELEALYRGTYDGGSFPTNFTVALLDDTLMQAGEVLETLAAAANIDTFSEISAAQLPTANGYTVLGAGNKTIPRSASGWGTYTIDDTSDYGQLLVSPDVSWSITGAGITVRWAAICDDNATVANRRVLVLFDFGTNKVVSAGQTLTLLSSGVRTT